MYNKYNRRNYKRKKQRYQPIQDIAVSFGIQSEIKKPLHIVSDSIRDKPKPAHDTSGHTGTTDHNQDQNEHDTNQVLTHDKFGTVTHDVAQTPKWTRLNHNTIKLENRISPEFEIPYIPLPESKLRTSAGSMDNLLVLRQHHKTDLNMMLFLFFSATSIHYDERSIDFSGYNNKEQTWFYAHWFHCMTLEGFTPKTIFDTNKCILDNPAELYYSVDNLSDINTSAKGYIRKSRKAQALTKPSTWAIAHLVETDNGFNHDLNSGLGTLSGTTYYVDAKFKKWWDVELNQKSNITAIPQKTDQFYLKHVKQVDDYFQLHTLINQVYHTNNYSASDPILFDLYLDRDVGYMKSTWNFDKPLVLPHTIWEAFNKAITVINQSTSNDMKPLRQAIDITNSQFHLPHHVISLERSFNTLHKTKHATHNNNTLHLVARFYSILITNNMPLYQENSTYVLNHPDVGGTDSLGNTWELQDYAGKHATL